MFRSEEAQIWWPDLRLKNEGTQIWRPLLRLLSLPPPTTTYNAQSTMVSDAPPKQPPTSNFIVHDDHNCFIFSVINQSPDLYLLQPPTTKMITTTTSLFKSEGPQIWHPNLKTDQIMRNTLSQPPTTKKNSGRH
ncbi:hypothetical protein Fot_05396 [Forsythia ovata]|uniref:Uncharacterized protein n=1 Tax=Forsythia ovata TaxID=205694 RepID=A0ABD1WQD8_9LAMI